MDELESAIAAAGASDRWSKVAVVKQASEAADTASESVRKWERIYRLFGATSEGPKDEVFAAVNMYFLKNGASPYGKYRKPIRTAGGAEVESGAVVQVVGRLEGEIRQFLRGRLKDSYDFLKHNASVRDDPELAATAEAVGVSRNDCWLLADWLGSTCPYFVGNEADVYAALRAGKIALAAAKRSNNVGIPDRVMEHAPEVKARQVHHQPPSNGHEPLF